MANTACHMVVRAVALGFGIAPIPQTHTTTSAPQIPEIASALPVSAFKLGIAAGAFAGGLSRPGVSGGFVWCVSRSR